MKTRIFVSYAWEDQDFVAPLAARLRTIYEVWFDKYVLTIGDSLSGKINEGLRSCDYGVVVLSPAFFQKKWPQNELDGFFALEETNRKVILPVWKNIAFDGVRKFSPILAGRLAVNANDGIDRVVLEIQRAIDVAERKISVSQPSKALERAKTVDANLREKENNERLSQSEAGVSLVQAAFAELSRSVQRTAEEISKSHASLRLTFHGQGSLLQILLRARHGLTLLVELHGLGGIYNDASVLTLSISKSDPFKILRQSHFTPTFLISDDVVWLENRQRYTTTELGSYVIELLLAEIDQENENH